MNKLLEEALWACEKWLQSSLKQVDDTAVIFHSLNCLEQNLVHIQQAFQHPRAQHATAIKTNPHISLLSHILKQGFSLEAASFEEILLALEAGASGANLVFDSPVKTQREIDYCHEQLPGILLNANSIQELARYPTQPNFRVGLRINPLVCSSQQADFNVSHPESKFGVSINHHQAILDALIKYPVTALHLHSGSQMDVLDNAIEGVKRVVDLAEQANQLLSDLSIRRQISTIDIGGGLKSRESPSGHSQMCLYADGLRQETPQLWQQFELVTEFGYWPHHSCGYVLSDIEYLVEQEECYCAFVHLGADMFVRNCYQDKQDFALYIIDHLGNLKTSSKQLYHIAGPLCFAGDYIAKQVLLPRIETGDKLLILATGANTYGLWSRHCSRSIPKVIGVDRKQESLSMLSARSRPF